MAFENSNISILLWVATADCENNTRYWFVTPKNPYDWQINTDRTQ